MDTFDSLRKEEQQYEQEITSLYSQHTNLFLTHSSDKLHLKVKSSAFMGKHYNAIITTSPYRKYDYILEVRGSVITKNKLATILEEGIVKRENLPILLNLNEEKGWLLSPKNISQWLFTHPLLNSSSHEWKSNCYLEGHFGSKILLVAQRDILAGEELLLNQKNFQNIVYY